MAKKPTYQIDKVRVDQKVSIAYTKVNKSGTAEFSIISPETPLPSFPEAMQALVEDVLYLCELSPKYNTNLTVRSVSFTYADEKMGVVISAVKKVSTTSSVFNIHTPYATEGEKGGLPEACVKKLQAVIAEANKYIEGERSQMEMQLEGRKN